MRYVCSFPKCGRATFQDYCRDHRATDDARVTCVFCKEQFDSLPFYGCCAGCYVNNAGVRAIVDEAHPQTVQSW